MELGGGGDQLREGMEGRRLEETVSFLPLPFPAPHPVRAEWCCSEAVICFSAAAPRCHSHQSDPLMFWAKLLPPLGGVGTLFLLVRHALSGYVGFLICAGARRKQLFAMS